MFKKLIKTLFLIGIFLYLVACGFLYFNQVNLIFFPQPLNQEWSKGFEQQRIELGQDQTVLRGWIKQSDASAPFVFYYGGNAEEVSNKLHWFSELGINNYLLMNYRGYGNSDGEPSENTLKADALRNYDEVLQRLNLKSDQIILFGSSLGSGIATYVASQRPAKKLILNTPYDSIVNVGQAQFPFLPVKLLAHQRFESIKLAPKIDAQMLCIVAELDRVIPPRHAKNLCSSWKGEMLEIVIPQAGHNNILNFGSTQQVIRDYIKNDI